MITEYSVVSTDQSADLIVAVNEMIKKGWQPLGHMEINSAPTRWFYQTMVKTAWKNAQ